MCAFSGNLKRWTVNLPFSVVNSIFGKIKARGGIASWKRYFNCWEIPAITPWSSSKGDFSGRRCAINLDGFWFGTFLISCFVRRIVFYGMCAFSGNLKRWTVNLPFSVVNSIFGKIKARGGIASWKRYFNCWEIPAITPWSSSKGDFSGRRCAVYGNPIRNADSRP